ncbi:Fructosamine/Ketosamine-3-kinase [Neurospora tetraspora]|uniref:protein-ribulosamine 3-kinase n=1 Tax=Neurospora tetraspora TaxID=94610 RepID=A0AAE0JQI5_9PEZI|nr:Fructosamine/Ketosamine-3-kinase [Neurospora tetraspora]
MVGKSSWATTSRITIRLPDGTKAYLFQKAACGKTAGAIMKGSFEADMALFAFIPTRVPRPIAQGAYVNSPNTHFYLSEFIKMRDNKLPCPSSWAAAVSDLHLNSMGWSPTGKFGLPTTTHLADVPVDNSWNASWESFWTQQMKSLFNQEERVNGRNEEVSVLRTAYLEKVIPRYLRPLEVDGRSITPCLIHSDLWPGNIKPRADTDELCMFDACAYWGHNEADLAICRNPRYKLGYPCVHEYQKRVPVSEPEADFDARNAVYALKYHVLLSAMHRNKIFRDVLIAELQSLVDRLDYDTEPDHDQP